MDKPAVGLPASSGEQLLEEGIKTISPPILLIENINKINCTFFLAVHAIYVSLKTTISLVKKISFLVS